MTTDKSVIDEIRLKTSSGRLVINETYLNLIGI